MSYKLKSRSLWGLGLAFVFAAATSVAQTYEVVRSLGPDDGSDPHPGLVQLDNGDFAGTTVGGMGTVFKMDSRGRLGTIYCFKGSEDGANPHGQIALAPDGLLYGTTMYGLAGWGGVYRLDAAGSFTVLKSFVPVPKGTEGEGAWPHAPLLAVADSPGSGGMFYGVTTRGGTDDLGTIYSMDTAYNVWTLRHFSGWDGAAPRESLIEHGGYLYGTTTKGGATDGGTIYRIGFGGSNFAVLHNFGIADGIEPQAPLIVVNGLLYGTTFSGGRFGKGTVFRMEPSGAGFTVIHHFNSFDGANPHAALVKARDGYLYGTTMSGGAGQHAYGNVFRLNWTGGDFSILHQFRGSDGAGSQSRLIEASDGALYGTTGLGGAENRGVVFRLVFVPVDAITPSSGPAAGDTPVIVIGANFHPGADLTFGGTPAADMSIKSDFQIGARTPALEPGTLNDILVDNLDRTRGGILEGFFADFLDVPGTDIFHGYVEKIVRNRITAGIGGGVYGRDLPATNAQMAVFLLKARHGPFYVPPPATGLIFDDVPADSPFASWIEQLYHEGITESWIEDLFYPNEAVTRERIAMLLLKAKYGPAHVPPPCRGIFRDVPCITIAAYPYAPWIEQLHDEGITGGCNGGHYFCPDEPATRGQTAVFLTKTFELP